MVSQIVIPSSWSALYPSFSSHARLTNSNDPSGRTLWIMSEAFSITARYRSSLSTSSGSTADWLSAGIKRSLRKVVDAVVSYAYDSVIQDHSKTPGNPPNRGARYRSGWLRGTMKKPIIVAVDDDAEVLQAISHDIRREYGDRFRIVRVDSGDRALDVLRQIKLADEVVALMVAD